MASPQMSASEILGEPSAHYDAVVIGAGVAGLYQVYKLKEKGMNVLGIEAASNVGGTWYWNRYPGARFDSESYIYQYWFSKEIFEGWNWSERFTAQPENERWLNYVADKCDLRKYYQFNTKVLAAHYDEESQRWRVKTDRGDVVEAKYLDLAGTSL